MKLLVVCYEFPPLGGGGSRVVHGLSRELAGRGHEIDVVSMGRAGLPRFEEREGVRVHRVPCLRRNLHVCTVGEAASYLLPAAARLRHLVRRHRHDLIHAHFIFPDGFVAWVARAGLGLPYLITAHGTDVPGYNPYRLRAAHAVLRPVWRRTLRGAAAVVCQSRLLRSLVLARAPDVMPRLIPNGFDPRRLRPRPPAERARRVLVVSRLLPRKGVQHVVEAFRELPRDHTLEIVGDGPFLPDLRRQATGLGERVRLRGWLDNGSEELRALYETSRVFVLPSEAENFPVVLLEAMAAGLPIVTTAGTGCAEVVGDAALLVPPRDPEAIRAALRRLLMDAELRERLGAAARRRLERRFAWDAVARQYEALYAEIAEAPGARAEPHHLRA